jgi:hypothetical protein
VVLEGPTGPVHGVATYLTDRPLPLLQKKLHGVHSLAQDRLENAPEAAEGFQPASPAPRAPSNRKLPGLSTK